MAPHVSIRRQTLIIGFASLVLVLVAGLLGAFEFLELKANDAAFNLRGIVAPTPSIVIVAIDDESFTQTGLQWPWPRAYLAQIVDRLATGKPKVIVMDIALYEKAQGDEILAAAIKGAGNVILVNSITIVSDPLYRLEQLNQPVPPLAESAASLGLANTPRDADGFVRATLAYQVHSGQVYYHWAVHAAALYFNQALSARPSQNNVALGSRNVPLYGQLFLINYRGPARTFKNVPAYQVVNGNVSPEFFKDKIVLIGATSESLHDTYPTPFKGDDLPMPGVEVVANAIETVLTGDFLSRWEPAPAFATTLLAGLLGLALNFTRRAGPALIILLGAMLAYALAWQAEFALNRIEMPLIAPETALLLAFVAPSVERAVAEEAEKRRVRGIFERFVAPQMVEQIIERGIAASRGKRTELTILFSDIRGFTTLSEKLTPDQVVRILNEYLEVMTDVIFRHRGTIDKFEGDAIVAFWGAPTPDRHHAQNATRAALEMRVALDRLRKKWADNADSKTFEIGIGINTGEVFVGLVGSSKRVNYTIIGDNANLAARLQDLTKEFLWPILISESTWEKIRGEFDTEFIEERLVKGKTVPVKIFKVLGKKGAPDEERVRPLFA